MPSGLIRLIFAIGVSSGCDAGPSVACARGSVSPTEDRGMSDWLGLREKVCVITGAAGGIGRGIALAFAQAGAKIVALDCEAAGCARDVEGVQRAGAQAVPLVCDVTDADAVAAAAGG